MAAGRRYRRNQPFAFQHQLEQLLIACTSATANLLTSCRMPSSCFQIFLLLPSSVTTTGWFSASLSTLVCYIANSFT